MSYPTHNPMHNPMQQFTTGTPNVFIPTHHQAAAHQSMLLMGLVLTDTGTYQDLYTRPFVVNPMADVTQSLYNALTTTAHRTVTGMVQSGFNPIDLSVTPERGVQIINGWSERRFSFKLFVRCHDPMGGERYEMISGYTNEPLAEVFSNNARVAPDMVFHVNRLEVRRRAPTMQHENYTDLSIIHNPLAVTGHDSDRYVITPYSLATDAIQLNLPGSINVVDTRLQLGAKADPIQRQAVSPVGLAKSLLDTAVAMFNSPADSESQVYVSSHSFAESYFMTQLSNMLARSPSTPFFTFRDLLGIDPSFETVGERIEIYTSQLSGSNVPLVGNTESWQSTDMTTHTAYSIVVGVNSLMSQLGSQVLSFTANNLAGQPMVFITNYSANNMTPQNSNLLFTAVTNRLVTDVLGPATGNHGVAYYVEYEYVPYSHVTISVGLNGQAAIPYTFPLFAEGIAGPNTTGSYNAYQDVRQVFDVMKTAVAEMKATSNIGMVDQFGMPIAPTSGMGY